MAVLFALSLPVAIGLAALGAEGGLLYLKKTGAQLWIQHDIIQFATLKKSPAYYD